MALHSVVFHPSGGEAVTFEVEVADSFDERAQGLMFREELKFGRGMIFVFPEESQAPFWMKDTKVSLDIIFVDSNGIVVDLVERATPFSEELLPADQPYRYAIEVPAGTIASIGLKVGDRVELPQGLGASAALP